MVDLEEQNDHGREEALQKPLRASEPGPLKAFHCIRCELHETTACFGKKRWLRRDASPVVLLAVEIPHSPHSGQDADAVAHSNV